MDADGYFDYLDTRWFFLTNPTGEDIYDALPDLEGRTIVAVTGNDYTPLNFVDPASGEAMGWEYDAVEEICQRLNCEVDWNVTAWDTMIAAVQEGQFDVGMDGITITEERGGAGRLLRSLHECRSSSCWSRADEDRFTTPEEFAADEELLIGSQAGTTNFYVGVYEVLDGDEANPRIKLFENFGAAVQALIAGDVDMVLMDAASSRGYIGANPDQLKVVGEPWPRRSSASSSPLTVTWSSPSTPPSPRMARRWLLSTTSTPAGSSSTIRAWGNSWFAPSQPPHS